MKETLEQIDKDIKAKHEMRGKLIDESVKIRKRLTNLTAVLEYQQMEILLLEEERSQLLGKMANEGRKKP